MMMMLFVSLLLACISLSPPRSKVSLLRDERIETGRRGTPRQQTASDDNDDDHHHHHDHLGYWFQVSSPEWRSPERIGLHLFSNETKTNNDDQIDGCLRALSLRSLIFISRRRNLFPLTHPANLAHHHQPAPFAAACSEKPVAQQVPASASVRLVVVVVGQFVCCLRASSRACGLLGDQDQVQRHHRRQRRVRAPRSSRRLNSIRRHGRSSVASGLPHKQAESGVSHSHTHSHMNRRARTHARTKVPIVP